MRISLDGIKFLIKNNDPLSTDWIVNAILIDSNGEEEEVFRSMNDTENIYSISATLKREDGRDVLPEEIVKLYADIRVNYDEESHSTFKRFECTQDI